MATMSKNAPSASARSRSARGLMTDVATSERLARVRQRDTHAELQVRSLLHRLGWRFRISNRDLPGSPDIANRKRRWIVFVHGCFWHAHRGCSRATIPKRNRRFWEAKFSNNRQRDLRSLRRLRQLGYLPVVVWECELQRPATLRRRFERVLAR